MSKLPEDRGAPVLKHALWIDVTRPVFPDMPVWPDDPEYQLTPLCAMESGSVCNVSAVSACVHTGTHVDAPLHYVSNGTAIDEMPMEAMIGATRVIAIDDAHGIYPDELQKWHIQPGERILFRTANSKMPWERPFRKDYTALVPEAAAFLAERKVRLVGIDYMSIGPFGEEGVRTHQVLLSAGVWVVENLDLSKIEPGPYEMVCAPLKLVGSEAAPARVLLKPLMGLGNSAR